jgi:hypothetical protein
MELYDEKNAEADVQRIKDDLEPYYAERLASGDIQSYEIKAHYHNMNLFYASCEYLPTKDGERFGPITAHFTILIRNGKIEYQNARF